MFISFLLHLYQPPTQEESVFKAIAGDCYIPLIKFIKSRKDFSLTLNIPLSLLEHMDKYGYKDWLKDVKDLFDSGRVEITGSGAYHPLLTKLPFRIVEESILLNEYGIGYYFGAHKGFEGEDSILIKNINGFFPPELAINENLISILESLGYKWVLVEEIAIAEEKSGIYNYQNLNIKLVARDNLLSNMFAFKRDDDLSYIYEHVVTHMNPNKPFIIALDGEFFGHHYKEGIYLLENFLDKIKSLDIDTCRITDLVDKFANKTVNTLTESTWATTRGDIENNNIYPLWNISGDKIHELLWKSMKYVLDHYIANSSFVTKKGYEITPIWVEKSLEVVEDEILKENIKSQLLLHKCLHSDQFWWSSKKELPNNVILYSVPMVKKALSLYTEYAALSKDINLINFINSNNKELDTLLKD